MTEYQEITIDEKVYKLYNSFSPKRLEEETKEEYKLRRVAIKNYIKNKPKLIHISSMLIPHFVNDELLKDNKGNVQFRGKTKGTTYTKDLEKQHLSLVEHLKSKQHE